MEAVQLGVGAPVKGRFTGMLQRILKAEFRGDVVAHLENWEKDIEEYENQSGDTVSDNIDKVAPFCACVTPAR